MANLAKSIAALVLSASAIGMVSPAFAGGADGSQQTFTSTSVENSGGIIVLHAADTTFGGIKATSATVATGASYFESSTEANANGAKVYLNTGTSLDGNWSKTDQISGSSPSGVYGEGTMVLPKN